MAKTDNKREPWQDVMVDVTKMMKEALEQAHEAMIEYVNKGKPTEERTRRIPSADSMIRMAVSIFDATVTAEGGRRMMEAQKESASGGQLLGGGHLLKIGRDGRPILG